MFWFLVSDYNNFYLASLYVFQGVCSKLGVGVPFKGVTGSFFRVLRDVGFLEVRGLFEGVPRARIIAHWDLLGGRPFERSRGYGFGIVVRLLGSPIGGFQLAV